MGGVDEECARLHLLKEFGIRHSSGALVERDVEGDHVGVLQQLVKRAEGCVPLFFRFRRVIPERLETESTPSLLDAAAYVTQTDDAYGLAAELDALAGGYAV